MQVWLKSWIIILGYLNTTSLHNQHLILPLFAPPLGSKSVTVKKVGLVGGWWEMLKKFVYKKFSFKKIVRKNFMSKKISSLKKRAMSCKISGGT